MAEEIEARNLQREPNENTMEFGRRVREAKGEVLPAPVENIFTEDEEEEDAYANFFSARKNQYKTETIGPMLEARGLDPKLAVDPNYVMPSIEQEQEQEKLTDEVLSQDKNWVAASKVMWETNENAETKKREGREEFYNTDNLAETIPYNPSSYKEPPTEDKDWGKYGIEMMGFFNYNIPHMGIDTVRLSEAEPWQRVAFYYMMSGYDQLGVSWNGTKRLFKGMLMDPSTYVGLGALGLGVKQVGKALGKDAMKLAIKQLKKTAVITGVEAGAYTAIDNFMRQKNAIGAGAQEEFDLMELLKMTGFGVTAGVTLGAGLPGVPKLAKGIMGEIGQQKKDNSLLNFIQKNSEGFTITVNDVPVPKEGYVVAPLKELEIVRDASNINRSDMRLYAKNIKNLSEASERDVFAGGWLNDEDGKYYLDAVQVFDKEDDALYVGALGDQEGIFNLGNFETTRTKEGIEKLKKSGVYSGETFNERRRNYEGIRAKLGQTRVDN